MHNTRCNVRCFFCDRDGFKGDFLDIEKIYKLENPIKNAETIDLTGWGEPFANPHLPKILDYINLKNKHKRIFCFITNGTILNEDYGRRLKNRLSSLMISLNAANAQDYAEIVK